eukprot:1133667-Pelagomonas_calceolata.AAC.1
MYMSQGGSCEPRYLSIRGLLSLGQLHKLKSFGVFAPTRLHTAYMPTYGSSRRMSYQQECMQVRSGPL